jgi:tetratricopeptide (TPR) repeat protein
MSEGDSPLSASERRLAESIDHWHREAPKRDEESRLFKETLDQAAVLVDAGDAEEAAAVLTRLASERAATNGRDIFTEFFSIVRFLNWTERRQVAEIALRAALALARDDHGPRESGTAPSLFFAERLRSHLLGEKRWAEAAALQEQIVALAEVILGEPATSRELRRLEELSSHVPDLDPDIAAGRRTLAVSALRRSLATYSRSFSATHALVGDAHLRLGFALAMAGDTAEAISELEQGLEISTDERIDVVAAALRLLQDLKTKGSS